VIDYALIQAVISRAVISIELLQRGAPLPRAEPWASMPNIGSW
jgi:lactoylglutathione lyase